jgi:hypothetical protein
VPQAHKDRRGLKVIQVEPQVLPVILVKPAVQVPLEFRGRKAHKVILVLLDQQVVLDPRAIQATLAVLQEQQDHKVLLVLLGPREHQVVQAEPLVE